MARERRLIYCEHWTQLRGDRSARTALRLYRFILATGAATPRIDRNTRNSDGADIYRASRGAPSALPCEAAWLFSGTTPRNANMALQLLWLPATEIVRSRQLGRAYCASAKDFPTTCGQHARRTSRDAHTVRPNLAARLNKDAAKLSSHEAIRKSRR